jgi:hypothetical protein
VQLWPQRRAVDLRSYVEGHETTGRRRQYQKQRLPNSTRDPRVIADISQYPPSGIEVVLGLGR